MGTSRTGAAPTLPNRFVSRTAVCVGSSTGRSPSLAGFPLRAVPAPAGLSPEEALPLNEILLGDCIASLEGCHPRAWTRLFADPPYNLQLDSRYPPGPSGSIDDAWDKLRELSGL